MSTSPAPAVALPVPDGFIKYVQALTLDEYVTISTGALSCAGDNTANIYAQLDKSLLLLTYGVDCFRDARIR